MTDEPVRVDRLLSPQEWSNLPDLSIHVVHSAEFTYVELRDVNSAAPLVEFSVRRGEAVRLGSALVEANPLG